jgi:hypothetical protein
MVLQNILFLFEPVHCSDILRSSRSKDVHVHIMPLLCVFFTYPSTTLPIEVCVNSSVWLLLSSRQVDTGRLKTVLPSAHYVTLYTAGKLFPFTMDRISIYNIDKAEYQGNTGRTVLYYIQL